MGQKCSSKEGRNARQLSERRYAPLIEYSGYRLLPAGPYYAERQWPGTTAPMRACKAFFEG